MDWDIPKISVSKRLLSNGLRVVYSRKSLLVTRYNLLSSLGMRYESFPESIHLLEHMLFKPEENIFPVFQRVGGDINGYVTLDQFSIYWNVPHRFSRIAIQKVSELLTENPKRWSANMLEREKQVILREIYDSFSNPSSFIHIFVQKKVLGENVPGTHSPEVIEEAFRSVGLDEIRSEVERFSPESSVLSVVGTSNDDLSALEAWRGKRPSIRTIDPRPQYGKHFVSWDSPEDYIAVSWLTAPRGTEDSEVLGLLSFVLTAFPTSRLYKKLRLDRGLVYYISASNNALIDTGYLSVYTSTTPRHRDDVIQLIISEFEKIGDEGITEDELEDIKNLFFGELYNLTDSGSALASILAFDELFYGNPLRLYEDLARRIQAFTIEKIQRTVSKYLTPEKAVICIVGRGNHSD